MYLQWVEHGIGILKHSWLQCTTLLVGVIWEPVYLYNTMSILSTLSYFSFTWYHISYVSAFQQLLFLLHTYSYKYLSNGTNTIFVNQSLLSDTNLLIYLSLGNYSCTVWCNVMSLYPRCRTFHLHDIISLFSAFQLLLFCLVRILIICHRLKTTSRWTYWCTLVIMLTLW